MFTLEEFVCADRVYKLTTSRNACTSRSTRAWTGTKVSANIDQGEKNGSSLSILLQFDLWNFSNKKKLQQKNGTMLDYIPHVCGCLPCMGQQWADNSSKRCKKHKTPRKRYKKNTINWNKSAFQHVLSSPNALQRKPRRFIARHQGMCLLYYSHRRWRVGCEYILMWQLMRFWVGQRTICYIYVCICLFPLFSATGCDSMPINRALKVRTGFFDVDPFQKLPETQVSAQVLQFNRVRFWPKMRWWIYQFVDITRAFFQSLAANYAQQGWVFGMSSFHSACFNVWAWFPWLPQFENRWHFFSNTYLFGI